jgi:3'-phosphoadenosine 5'-phosphosulfate sulfotransferase (PAPS reductase)/FAD synthetase
MAENKLSDADKATFKAAAERRKANNIKLGQFRVLCDTNQVVSLTEFYDGWVDTLGKQHAVDYLIVCMRRGDEALRRAMEKRDRDRKSKG